MNIFWTYFELLINAFESFIICEFISRFLGYNYNGLKRYLSFIGIFLVVFAETTLTNYITFFEGIAIIIPFLLYFTYSLLFLKGKPIIKLFICLISLILLILINTLTSFFTSLLTGINISKLMSEENLYRFIVIIITKLVFFYITRIILKYRGQKEFSVNWTDWIYVLVIPITSIFTIVSLIEVAFVSKYSEQIFLLLSVFGVVMTNIVTYYLFTRINKDNKLLIENSLLQQQYYNQRKYMAEIKNLDKEIRIIRHDMNNHFLCITSYLQMQKYDKAIEFINNVYKKFSTTNKIILTGDEAIDCIVNCKLDIARQAGIGVTSVISCDKKNIEDIDISIIIGNLIDNAIDACEKKSGVKIIEIEIYNNKNYLIITVKNSIEKTVLRDNPKLKTIKKDKRNHGFGTSSIKSVVEKYNGMIDYYELNNMFCCSILLQLS
jgi:two-component system sensor histidine kinase AgrC